MIGLEISALHNRLALLLLQGLLGYAYPRLCKLDRRPNHGPT